MKTIKFINVLFLQFFFFLLKKCDFSPHFFMDSKLVSLNDTTYYHTNCLFELGCALLFYDSRQEPLSFCQFPSFIDICYASFLFLFKFLSNVFFVCVSFSLPPFKVFFLLCWRNSMLSPPPLPPLFFFVQSY